MLVDGRGLIKLEAKELSRIAAEWPGPQFSIDDRIMAGPACVAGTRTPVQAVVSRLADTLSADAVLDEHPQLEAQDVRACLRYAYEVLDLIGDADPSGRKNPTYQRLSNSGARVVDKDRRRGTMTWTTEGSDR
jgi:uncharacterized protein (DUF433 family)